ncbi:hypothetical protein RJ639_022280 [Escallonia herrerae]|uniref:Retrotransposon gag domain-containing protein n=1 Tax=Escallonia herrerae TaxID=1293975 RepID=A0AA88V3U5_9ASTE|nr:hypothetical protein RJ639_022280 [Escallonia herrerae]
MPRSQRPSPLTDLKADYSRRHESETDPSYQPEREIRKHVTKSGSCFQRETSMEDNTNSPLSWVTKFEIDAARTKGIVPKDEFMHSNEKCVPKGELLTKPSLGPARRNSLPQGKTLDTPYLKSIHSFAELSDLFQKHFVSSRTRRKNSASLLNVIQERNKSLSRYLGRFNTATLEIDSLDESVKYTAFMRRLRPTSKFALAVNKSPPGTMSTLLDKANKYIQAEEYLETHKGHREDNGQEQEKKLKKIVQEMDGILREIKDKEILEKPDKMRSAPSKRDRNLWCRYHNDHGHTTDNCELLKREIEALIKRGHLKKYVARRDDRREVIPAVEGIEERQENAGTINTISEGIAARSSSGRGRKAYTREVCITSQSLSKKQKTTLVPTISFSEDEIGDIKTPHDDPLVDTLRVGNFDVKRILVNNGSSSEVLFYEAFQKMNIPSDRLRKMDTPLYGFSNHPVAVEGIIVLPVAIGTPPTQAKLMLDFVVVRVPSAYNAILGRTALNQLKAVVSTYHLKIKFPTKHGVGEVKGDQIVVQQCYMASCRAVNKEAFIIKDLRDGLKENL